MNQMVEATIDEDGKVQLKESISLSEKHKALVIILEEDEAWKAYQ